MDKKISVVTGGGAGIGKAISLRLAKADSHIAILERNEEQGREVAETILQSGGSAEWIACDVGEMESVEQAFARFETIDALINNAGIAHIGNAETTTPEDMDRLYRVNVKGVYHCLHFGIPRMKGKGGSIVNMASIAAKAGVSDRFAYSMTKGAVFAMTLSVARDYVGQGIRCNCLCPGRVHTPFVDGYLEKYYPNDKEEMFAKLSAYQPIGRMGNPEEIAALVAYLCSEDAQFITGAAWDIDGGVIGLR